MKQKKISFGFSSLSALNVMRIYLCLYQRILLCSCENYGLCLENQGRQSWVPRQFLTWLFGHGRYFEMPARIKAFFLGFIKRILTTQRICRPNEFTMNLSYVQPKITNMLFWKMRRFEGDSDGNGFIERPPRRLCFYLFQQTQSTNDVITQPLTIRGTKLAPVLYICWKQSHSLRGSERSWTLF